MKYIVAGLMSAFCTVASADDLPISIKICSEYTDGQYFNCPQQGPLSTDVSFDRIYVYLELDWLALEASRPQQAVYLRWEFHAADGEVVLLSNPRENDDYIWRPLTYNDPTRWDVSQRVWPEKKGSYRFFVYTDLASPDNYLLTEAIEVY